MEKVAHFILEVGLRLHNIFGDMDNVYEFPIKQEEIGDILGLSTVHVNRSMNELKRHHYIEYDRSSIKILDRQKLFNLAGFEPQFLEAANVDWHKVSE